MILSYIYLDIKKMTSACIPSDYPFQTVAEIEPSCSLIILMWMEKSHKKKDCSLMCKFCLNMANPYSAGCADFVLMFRVHMCICLCFK